MAGGGQMRPQGSAIADARASGITGIASGNGAAKPLTLSFNNNSPMQGSMSSNIVAQGGGQDIGTMFHNQMPDGTPRPRFTPGDGLAGARVPMGFGNLGETKIKDGMPATGVSDITPLPGPPMSGGKGGGNGEMPRPMPAPAPSTQYSPMAAPAPAPAQPQGFNVNQAAAGGLQKAFQGTQQAMQGPNIGQFMNPYTKQVTQNTLTDLERQRQMQMNTLGAQASNARAFGGSRHGVAEALTNEGFARQGAQAFGNLQQQGFNTALQAAQNQQQMQMGGAAQLGQLGQQAFGTSQAIQQQQGQQGLLQQGIQQALIDAAKQQYAGYTGAPAAALNAPLQALGVAQQGGAKDVVQSQNPGLFSYLQTAAMLCWVAREVYGEQDPKWMQFREWVIGHSPDWFYKAYSNYGEKFAKVVRKVPAIKVILRPFMDAKRKSIGYKA